MMRWQWINLLAVLVAAVGFAQTARGQEGVRLKAFVPGASTFYQTLSTTTTQKMVVMDQNLIQEQKETLLLSWTPQELKAGEAGKYKVLLKILDLKLDNGSNRMPPAFVAILKAALGGEITLLIAEDKEGGFYVKEVQGLDALRQWVQQRNPPGQRVPINIFSAEAFKMWAAPILDPIPPREKAARAGWARRYESDGQDLTRASTYRYTLKGHAPGNDRRLLEIGVRIDVALRPGQANAPGRAPPFRILKFDVKSAEDSRGAVVFDSGKGRVQRADFEMHAQGNLRMDVAGMPTVVPFEQRMTTHVRTTDTDPRIRK